MGDVEGVEAAVGGVAQMLAALVPGVEEGLGDLNADITTAVRGCGVLRDARGDSPDLLVGERRVAVLRVMSEQRRISMCCWSKPARRKPPAIAVSCVFRSPVLILAILDSRGGLTPPFMAFLRCTRHGFGRTGIEHSKGERPSSYSYRLPE